MRPLELTISAFSSYSGKTVLDMEKLGTSGLYLITGETGAGKTTIFDAIAFALYGVPSGSNRSSGMLRSKYADPDTPTEVELKFSYGGKVYKIRRNPEYERPAKKGGGFTKQRAEAELILPDGKVISKVKDVDAAVRNIMGVDHNQFSQIAMIAQGDFLKLLTASTESRQEIFRKIFGTSLYRSIQDSLRVKFLDIKKDYEAIDSSIRQYIKGGVCKADTELSAELEKATAGEISYEESASLIEKIIADDLREKSTLEKEISDNAKLSDELAKSIEKGESYLKIKSELEKTTADKSTQEISLKELSTAVEEQKKRQPEADKLDKKITIAESLLPEYKELEKTRSELSFCEKKIAGNTAALEKNKTEKINLNDEILRLSEEAAGLENAGSEKEKLIAEKNRNEEKLRAVEAAAVRIADCRKYEKVLEQLQALYLEKQADADKLNEKYTAQNRAFLNEQAGILADGLTDGTPCPVCGSLSHPHLAEKSCNAPTESELKALHEETEKAQETAAEASRDASTALGNLNTAKDELARRLAELCGEENSDNPEEIINCLREETKSAINILNEKIHKEEKRVKRKNKLSELIPEKRDKLNSLGEEISRIESECASDKVKKSTAEEHISSLLSKLEFATAEDAQKEISDMKKSAEEIRNGLKKAEEKLSECEKRYAALIGTAEQLKKQLSEGTETDVEAEKAKKAELSERQKNLSDSLAAVSGRISMNRHTAENIKNSLKEKAVLEKKYIAIKSLHETAGGGLSGQGKLSLETYVQTAYFDRIIRRANIRLRIMTNGQYELIRRKSAENNRSQTGLELEVTDHYNSTVRDVKSLSGGESFKASLALALGLSDEIQSCAGGVKLDTMFIDEGFGSLDENSLQQAVNALAELTGEARLVGIISHVSELKRKIDKQIVVTKEKSGKPGTRVEIVC